MNKRLAAFILAAAALVLAACGPRNLIVLVPAPDGTVGGIRVVNAAGSVDLNAANQATVVKHGNTAPSRPAGMTAEELRAIFSDALAIQPAVPIHFLLYFEIGSTRINPESASQFPEIIAVIRQRASSHISVVGHSDTLGDKLYNQNLSMRRAAAVKDLLTQQGVPGSHIETAYHGDKNLLIQTGDNVAEPKNRRVEVVVR